MGIAHLELRVKYYSLESTAIHHHPADLSPIIDRQEYIKFER